MEKKKTTEAQMRATAKYQKNNYFTVSRTRFYKSDEQAIRAEAERQGLSLNAFIVKCVLDSLNDKHIERN